MVSGSNFCVFHTWPRTDEQATVFEDGARQQLEDGDFNFAGYQFPPGWRSFKDRDLTCADFQHAVFKGVVVFSETRFHAEPKNPVAVNFFRAEFRHEADFSSAHFNGLVQFIKCRFAESTHFVSATFEGQANFSNAVFSGLVEFAGVDFGGSAEFVHACFAGFTQFWHATFAGSAGFDHTWFGEDAVFMHACFNRTAHFGDARFGGRAGFRNARFAGDGAVFAGAHFASKADLNGAVFSGLSQWEGAHFQADADFTDVAELAGSRFLIGLPRGDRKSADQETRFTRPATGSQICRLAKETARRAGDYRLAGDYFYFERMYADLARLPRLFFAWRRLNHWLGRSRLTRRVVRWLGPWPVIGPLLRWELPEAPRGPDGKPLMTQEELEKAWLRPELPKKPWRDKLRGALGLIFGWALFGYGERPVRVFGWSLVVVCLWALLYWGLGLVRLSGATYPLHSVGQHLYFSVVTFTTLGFGDFEPVKSGLGMFLAASEAFIGMFMMALFVVSVAKRFTRG